MTVTGMSCEHCMRAVHDELMALDGASAVAVDLSSGLVRIHATPPMMLRCVPR